MNTGKRKSFISADFDCPHKMLRPNENPKVSVILPTYNRAHLVARAIESVLKQTYQNLELIVVDDGSTDDTEAVVSGFKDARIRYLRHEKNRGQAAALNTGIKIAGGEYIAFQDSDDMWLPGKLEKQMEAFKIAPPQIGVVYTGFHMCKADTKIYVPFSDVAQKEGDVFDSLLRKNFVGTPAAVVRKGCFEKTGLFDEDIHRLIDWDLFIRISRRYHFKYIDEPLLIAYCQPDGISTDKDAFINSLIVILKKYFEDFKKNRKILAGHYLHIRWFFCSNGKPGRGMRYLIKAVQIYPPVLLGLFKEEAISKTKKLFREKLQIGLKIIFKRHRHPVAVVIPIHKTILSDYEKISFDRCLRVLRNYPIIIAAPRGLVFENTAFSNSDVRFEFFDTNCFKDNPAYNKLMLSLEFYRRFLNYEYMLIYQLDAFVFRDELLCWCNKKLDYIGAPWFEDGNLSEVGNGGFSLRRIKGLILILLLFKKNASKWSGNEDIFWAYFAKRRFPFFKIADFKTALKFSFETYPERCYELNNNSLPFGCHGWGRYNAAFWRAFFNQAGYHI